MTSSSAPPKLKLSRLREIGWSLWDPIGLSKSGERWDQDENVEFADEYDSYLIEAAGLLRRGVLDSDVVDFLVNVETEHMGLPHQVDTYERAKSTVAAIRAEGNH